MENNTYHHKNLREKLIEAGIRLMNEEGYRQLSLRKIAAACGVSHGAPYRHFNDKEALLRAMEQYVEERFTGMLKEAVENSSKASHPMIEFGKAYVVFFAEHPEYFVFFTQQEDIYVHFSESQQQIVSNYQPFNIFKEEAEKHFAALKLPKSQFVTGMVSMWSMVHGLAGMVTMPDVKYDGDWGDLTERVLKGVQPHE